MIIELIFLLTLVLLLIYAFYCNNKSNIDENSTENRTFLESQGVKVVNNKKPTGFFTYLSEFKEPHEQGLDDVLKIGKVFAFLNGNDTYINVADPEWLRQIFIKKFNDFEDRPVSYINNMFPSKVISFLKGDEWRDVRKISSHAFTSAKMKNGTETIRESADSLCNYLSNLGQKVKYFNARIASLSLVAEVSCAVLIGLKKSVIGDPDNDILKNAENLDFTTPKYPKLHKIYTAVMKKLNPNKFFSSLQFFEELSKRFYDERLKNIRENPDDIIGIYLEEYLKNGNRGGIFKDDSVARHHVFSLFASFDTTTMAIATTLHSLALNQTIQNKCRKEAVSALEKYNDIYELSQNLPYLENCVNEDLRLYPPGYITGRLCVRDTEICGIKIKAGTQILIPIYAIHRHPEFYKNPSKFIPERFSKDAKLNNEIDPILYLPFGQGPRHCLGKRLAVLMVLITVAKLLKRFKFFPVPKTPMEIKFGVGALGVLRQNEIIIGFEEIKN